MTEIPKLRKTIKGKASDALFILSYLYFQVTNEKELKVIEEIIKLSEAGPVVLSKELRELILNSAEITDTNLSTILHRLEKKGAIKKDGKTIYLPPVFNKFYNIAELVVRIQEPE
jgi:hypothetical protein